MNIFINNDKDGLIAGNTVLEKLSQAKENITIVSPYFSPNFQMQELIKKKSEENIAVQFVINLNQELFDTYASSFSKLEYVLKYKIAEIYYSNSFHCKIYIIDNKKVFVGSMNFSNRGFRVANELIVDISNSCDLNKVIVYVDDLLMNSQKLDLKILSSKFPLIKVNSLDFFDSSFNEQEREIKARTFIEHKAKDEYNILRHDNKISLQLLEWYNNKIKKEEEAYNKKCEKIELIFNEIDNKYQGYKYTVSNFAKKIIEFSKHFDYIKRDHKSKPPSKVYHMLKNILEYRRDLYYEKMKKNHPNVFQTKLFDESENYNTGYLIFGFDNWRDSLKIELFKRYKSYFDEKKLHYPQPSNSKLRLYYKNIEDKRAKLFNSQIVEWKKVSEFDIYWLMSIKDLPYPIDYLFDFKIELLRNFISENKNIPSDMERAYIENNDVKGGVEGKYYKDLTIAINARKSLIASAKKNSILGELINFKISQIREGFEILKTGKQQK